MNLLMTRSMYNSGVSEEAPNKLISTRLMAYMNHVGIEEVDGSITLLKDRTEGKNSCTYKEWLKRTIR